ncbi:FAD-dependent oxidoreductase [Rhodococcus sp. T2V]|uniref:NAD(P)/FAD-dependent oxidoreductase n=1 Tax=Rhodococcus sp. T2V TaxID=3034164 RepID=UPI0023E2B2A4|nr:FAD-dependent oxidoreductase [Rhodococcus sp. T2V]MDF3311079.1 FAD-dependent oxidoreductase [Rhodococcus sp. T2V]
MEEPVVIVGASLAGVSAAKALRDEGYQDRLIVIGDELHKPYDRPPLSKELLLGTADTASLALPSGSTVENVEWSLGTRVESVDFRSKRLETNSGTVQFGSLAIATGGRPRRLPHLIPDGQRIFELRKLEDALGLKTALEKSSSLLIVGSGFIGVEVASVAVDLGIEVDVVSLDAPLSVAGERVSTTCEEMLRARGVHLWIRRSVKAAHEGKAVLDDGTELAYDTMLVAIGSSPNVEWLAGNDLDLTNGVLCDAHCAVLGPDGPLDGVVAAGDVARWPNPLFDDRVVRIEHWSNAVEQGRAAARTLLYGHRSDTAFAAVPSFWSDHCGTRLQSVGIPALADRLDVVEHDPDSRNVAIEAFRDDRLIGAQSYGIPRALARVRIRMAREFTARAEKV